MKLRQFVAALWEDWGARITGPLSIPLTVLAFFAPTTTQQIAWAVLAVVLILFAAYRIWSKEHDGRVSAEARVTERRPRLVIGCDWTFGRDFAPASTSIKTQLENILGPDRDYYSPYYVRNDGGDTAYNVSLALPDRFGHVKFLMNAEYPADGQRRALHIRVGQRNVNYDLPETLRDAEGVMSDIVAGVNSSGTHDLRVPIRITYSDQHGGTFTDEWELFQRSRWEKDNDRIVHEPLIIKFISAQTKQVTELQLSEKTDDAVKRRPTLV